MNACKKPKEVDDAPTIVYTPDIDWSGRPFWKKLPGRYPAWMEIIKVTTVSRYTARIRSL